MPCMREGGSWQGGGWADWGLAGVLDSLSPAPPRPLRRWLLGGLGSAGEGRGGSTWFWLSLTWTCAPAGVGGLSPAPAW